MYLRQCARQTLLVIANYSSDTVEFEIPDKIKKHLWARRLSNKANTSPALDTKRALLPWEVEIYELAR